MLRQSIVNMNQIEKRSPIESVSHNAIVDVSFKLFGMPAIRNPGERQERFNRHMAFTQHTFVNKSQDANVPSKRQRREIVILESHFTRDTEITGEIALE